jgi:hypothetical protein
MFFGAMVFGSRGIGAALGAGKAAIVTLGGSKGPMALKISAMAATKAKRATNS